MKKKSLFSTLTALLCVFTLTACSAESSTAFTYVWNPTQDKTVLPGTYERYEYDVELKEGTNEHYSVSYEEGKYVTWLRVNPENSTQYIYTTSFNAKVSYQFGEQTSEVFEDSIETEVILDGNNNLRPISSKKTVRATSPTAITPQSLAECYNRFHYEITTTYSGKKGTFTRTNLLEGSTLKNATKTFTASGDHTYIDNEQLYLCMRANTETSMQSLRYFNTSAKVVQTLNISKEASGTAEFTFPLNDVEETASLDYIDYLVSISADNPGASQTVRVVNGKQNKYRRMILSISTPLSYHLGTIVFTLQNATTF